MGEWTTEAAEWYAEKYGEYPTNRLAIDRLNLPAEAAVLDIGCGTGAALRHLAATGTTGPLVGVDYVPRMIEIAEARRAGNPTFASLAFLVGAADALPVPDAAFDVVLAFDSFDHWRNPAAGLAEVRRALRPGGQFAVVKDQGVPSQYPFTSQAAAAGFAVDREEQISAEGVRFTLWQCRPT